MSVPYSLLVIKPLTVSRGDAPKILSELLDKHPLVLRKFRSWSICDTTLRALSMSSKDTGWNYEVEKTFAAQHLESWICLITHADRHSDPQDILMEVCGSPNPAEWQYRHLRHRYSALFSKLDPVVHLSPIERQNIEASLLFINFNEKHV
jgi:hypothetical protein